MVKDLREGQTIAALLLASALWIPGAGRAAADPAAQLSLAAPARSVWAGEVFDLALDIHATPSEFRAVEGAPVWNSPELVVEDWSRAGVTGTAGDSNTEGVAARFTASALALRPGFLNLAPASQSVILQTGYSTGESPRPIIQKVRLHSPEVALEVKGLPAGPAEFFGAVGHFTLESSIDTRSADARSAQVGRESIWTLTLRGRGNWPQIRGLPARQVPDSLDAASAPILRQPQGADLFERYLAEDVSLIPRQAGRFTLGPVSIVVFDPSDGHYVRVMAPPITLDVAVAADTNGAASADPGQSRRGEFASATVLQTPQRPVAAPLPPRLMGHVRVIAPPAARLWHLLLLAPVVMLGLFWLAAVYLRARRDDPVRAVFGAWRGIGETLTALIRAGTAPEQRILLRQWQMRVARLRGRLEAVPIASNFKDAALSPLWMEADGALYGRSAVLPEGWSARAHHWWGVQPVPPRKTPAAASFWKKQLAPLLLVALGATGIAIASHDQPASLEIADPLVLDPLDAAVHFNAALDQASRGRAHVAASQAAIAWTQLPRSEAARQLWSSLAERAHYALPQIGGLPRPESAAGRFAGIATPAAWRWLAVASAFLAALGAGLWIAGRYGFAPAHLLGVSAAFVCLALLMLATAVTGARKYGAAADPAGVILIDSSALYSTPVESATLEQSPPVAAGALARADGQFLGWLHVSLDDGRSGWIRTERIAAIWQ